MREIGKAKSGDFSGHFAGERHEAVAPLAQFLVGARQLSPLEEGRALNNDGTAVIERHQDTEAYPPLLQRAEGNGHHGNGHGGNGAAPLSMEPQAEADLFGDPVAPEPQIGNETALGIEPESSSDTVHDTALAPEPRAELAAEPQAQALSLDATEPGLTLDSGGADTVFDTRLEPEAEPDNAVSPPPASAPDTEAKTRVMSPRDIKARAQELAPEELKLETGPVAKLAPEDDLLKDDDETSASKGGEPEKITTKVEPKPAQPAQPGQVVRDTVNFYNQTMALRDLMEANARPAPNNPPIATQKLPGPLDAPGVPLATHKIPPPPDLAARQAPPAAPPEQPAPLAALEPEDGVQSPAPEPQEDSHDEQTRAFMLADLSPASDEAEAPAVEPPAMPEPSLLAAETPSLDHFDAPELDEDTGENDSTATREVPALRQEAPNLAAAATADEADRKDTDRFNLADMRPADLPPPEGTDRIDKSAFPQDSEEPVRVADEDVAARRDTQRFFVSDLVGVATFKAAPKPVPLADDGDERDLTSSGSTTGLEAAVDKTSLGNDETSPPRPLPPPEDVADDFTPPPSDSGTRIMPDSGAPAHTHAPVTPVRRGGSNRLRAAQSQGGEKITEKVKQEASSGADTDRIPALGEGADETPKESPVKKITDALTRRLRAERDETRKLIEEAEGVLLRLRQTPVSARMAKAPPPQPEEETEPQPSAEPAEVFDALPPLEEISSATIHDLRLAEELLETSKALSQHKTQSDRHAPLPNARDDANGNGHHGGNGHARTGDDPLLRIEKRLAGAANRIDEILSSTSAALDRVTGALTREEFEARVAGRERAKPVSLRKALSGRAMPLGDDEGDPYAAVSLDELVSASSRRDVTAEPATPSGRRILEDEPVSRRTSARLASSSLTEDLGKLLSEAARSTRIHNAPKADNIPREEPNLEITEGALWQSLLGIAGMSAFLVALLVWVWFLITSHGG